MQVTRIILSVFISLVSTTGVSGEKPFEKRKSQRLQMVEKRMQNLQEVRTCIQGAANGKDLKSCNERQKAMQEEMKKLRQKMKQEKLEKKMDHMKKTN